MWRDYLTDLRARGNRRELWELISDQFGLDMPYRAFTPGNSTLFDFTADAFFHPAKDIAAWSCRSGGKTLGASVIAGLEFLEHNNLQARVLSGSEDQARYLYEYWQKWCQGPLAGRLSGDINRQKTPVAGGRFEILAASQKRVRGGKVQRLFEDELDEIDPDIDAAAVGMLDSKPGIPARTVYASTWHYPGGPMGKLIEACPGNGVSLHTWNLWEAIEKCPKDRHLNGKGCKSCRLSEACLAKAREIDPRRKVGIASEVPCGIYKIADAIKAFSKVSQQMWDAEFLCKRPTLTGLVYPQFDRRVHVKPDLDFDEALAVYRAIDFGLNNFICLWIQTDKRGNVLVVDEYWAQDATIADNGRKIAEMDKDSAVTETFVDPAGRSRSDQTGFSDIDILKGLGIPCTYTLSPWAREVHNGVNLLRAWLQPAAGPPRLFIAGKCKQLISAFENYKLRMVNKEYIDEPIKPQAYDHPMDALRYYFVNCHAQTRSGAKQLGYT